MENSNNTNIFIIFLSFLMIVLSITSIELPWQRIFLSGKFLGMKIFDLTVDHELFDSGIYYPTRLNEVWIEITSNSINNGIMTCMGINILSLVIILINPFKRFFKFISDSHYLFIEKILIRSLSVMIVIFYILSTTIGLMLSGTYCQVTKSSFDSTDGSTLSDESCYSLDMFSKSHIQDLVIRSTEVSSKPMKGWYLSIVLLFLSLILAVMVFIRFKRISPKLVDLGYRHYLTNNKSSSNNDTGSEVIGLSSNESDNIATVEIEPLL
ncbi:hypothetical protein DDB_G0290203 [Dictyostelium discoideum AX4]|uniref:Putative uncharacterized transmembrane protein DDB_G0290203 n=1 Tax=Dictyostelium discoideum TaxID=44689 RepID=Y8777_DICDI|nr:hypothetical protein DDB_G0290203 [Dictyostelium discoideum AX4]Q54GE8.1 RecName: Full=Putative uncharacterized transmembrane protein DDB_G0290203 [Dictyostelium discoideum]EAL62323.1 hypothetical protein DDB_G0290203 [Dictyostelium discoideum AX4]|eukprot:XP_635830.1 hypothetical protein DDB_G0290203 [Dictyostelium discoideum AX4]